jgi:hypothetical protein
MPAMPSDKSLIDMALLVTADKIATDPWFRDSLVDYLPGCTSADPEAIVSRLFTLRRQARSPITSSHSPAQS